MGGAAADVSPRLRRGVGVLLSVGGLVAAVAVLAATVDLGAAAATLGSAHRGWLAAAAGMSLLAPVLVALKLLLVLRLVDVRRSFGRCWSAVMAAVTLNAVIPGRGGDFVRAAFLAEEPGTLSLLVGAVLVERLLDVLMLGLMAGAASLAGGGGVVTWIALAVGAVAVGAVAALALGHRLPVRPEAAERAGRAARALGSRPGLAMVILGMTAICWTNNVATMELSLRAVGADIPTLAVYEATPIAVLTGILPVSVNGIGTRDAAMVMLLAGRAAKEQIVAGAFAYFLLNGWFLALIGMVALGRETLRRVRVQADAARSPPA